MKVRQTIIYLFLILPFLSCCREEADPELKHSEGYIVGFDNCSVRNKQRIGYVFISTDFKDSLLSYNISDSVFKMPASIFLNSADTLFRLPASNFVNFMESAYFPESVRFNYKIKITYKFAKSEQRIFYLCFYDQYSEFTKLSENNQVIIKSASLVN